MTKRTSTKNRPPTQNRNARTSSASTPADPLEERVVAIAEQVGRALGTMRAKAGGWVDPKALSAELASVRDKAADLVKQLATAGSGTASAPATAPRGRSGGVVDAPGKKHRKPLPKTNVPKDDWRIPKAMAARQMRNRRKVG